MKKGRSVEMGMYQNYKEISKKINKELMKKIKTKKQMKRSKSIQKITENSRTKKLSIQNKRGSTSICECFLYN